MTDTKYDPWTISETDFPAQGTPVEKWRFFLQYAILAPSGHNSQPWLFHIKPKALELYADRTRALPVVDPDDRELIISCGAALFHVRLAMRYFGYADEFQLTPDPDNPDLMARVHMAGPWEASKAERALFKAIPLRRTNRHRYEEEAVPDSLVADLQAAASTEGAWFEVIEGDHRLTVADLIAEADHRQMADKRFRRELAAWIHPKRHESHDGMPAYAPTVDAVLEAGGPFVLRTFELSDMQAAVDRRIALGSPLLAVLGANGDEVNDWLNTGQALARLLLQACAAGVTASYLNQPIEVPALRPQVSELVKRLGYSQLLLRLGYGPDIKPTPRRAIAHVLV